MGDRYTPVLEPTNLWTVWDHVLEEPAFFADRILAGLDRSEAEAACLILNGVTEQRERSDAA